MVNGKGDIFQSISVELGRIRNQSGSGGPISVSIHPSIGGKLTGVAMTGIRTYGGHQGTDLIASEAAPFLEQIDRFLPLAHLLLEEKTGSNLQSCS